MKNWFINLEQNKKILIHILMFALILIILPLTGLVFLWFASIPLEIIFVVWHIKYKSPEKEIEKKELTTETYQHKEIIPPSFPKKEEKPKTESMIDLDEIIDDVRPLRLKYQYKEHLCFCENYDSFSLGSTVNFEHDPTNPYDDQTIVVKVGDTKIGLMYKGDCRDIIHKCLKSKKFTIESFIWKKDVENDKIGIKVGFYVPIDTIDTITASITKTNKIDILTDEKRQEQVDYLSEKDRVCLEEDYNCDGLLVKTETGEELGELSVSVSEKILDKTDDVENLYARVTEIEEDYNGKIKAKITIYF